MHARCRLYCIIYNVFFSDMQIIFILLFISNNINFIVLKLCSSSSQPIVIMISAWAINCSFLCCKVIFYLFNLVLFIQGCAEIFINTFMLKY